MFLNESRKEYTKYDFDKSQALADPFDQFDEWFEFAKKNAVFEPNAMHVSTVDKTGQPKNRVVLLKSYNNKAFVFFSNYTSDKGKEIGDNPKVALTFFWPNIERQVRIEGEAHHSSPDSSDAYFKTRPRDSQLSAWASDQSAEVSDRAELNRRLDLYKKKFPLAVARPEHWGGFDVKPHRFEFWQGRENRYHDRIVYEATTNGWKLFRLSP
jgi:pyridoxamine 5'-phosphate oxidase